MIKVGIVVAVAFGAFLAGAIIQAMFTRSKISDLNSEIWLLRKRNESLRTQLAFLREYKKPKKTT